MSSELKIVTLNCWGVFTPMCCDKRHERLAAIAKELSKGLHDVVCLQEVWTDADFEKIRRVMSKSYQFSHYFHSNLVGSGCCIFSRHPVQEVFFHRYTINGFPQRLYHGDWFGGKGVGLARIRFGQFDINVYVTHLHAQYAADDNLDEYRSHRVVQAYELARFIRLTAGGADSIFLCGDMNLHPKSVGLRIIETFGGLRDSWFSQPSVPKDEFDGSTCGRPNNSFATPKDLAKFPRGERLDYIFFANNAGTETTCKSCDLTLGKIEGENFNYSDHEGVCSVFLLKRAVTAVGHCPDRSLCREMKDEIRMEMKRGLEQVSRDRLFYLATCILSLAVIYFLFGTPCVVFGAMYLLFALWTAIVVKEAERRSIQSVIDQVQYDFSDEGGERD